VRALIDSDPHISATINKSRGVQPSAARQFLFELEALENVLVGQDKQVRRSKADLSATLNGRPPSELEWLAGLSLPLVYERHFSARAGRSRNARGEAGLCVSTALFNGKVKVRVHFVGMSRVVRFVRSGNVPATLAEPCGRRQTCDRAEGADRAHGTRSWQ